GHRRQVILAGLLRPTDDLSRRGLSGLMLTDISTAQELLDKTGQLSHIDLILPPDADVQAILDRLPPNARLQTAALRNATIRQMTAAFNLNLSALSLLALIVGMFLIYNTISFSVVQRRPVLAVLRCLGVTRGEIFSLVLLEALMLGGLGAVIGLGLGVALGRGLVGLVTRTINDLYFTLTVQTVSVSPWTLYKGLVAGLAASLLAAAVPAWEASTVPPHTALKRSEQEGRLARLLPLLSLTGAGLVAGGWLVLYGSGRSLGLSFTGMFMILFGAAMLTPLLTRGLMRLLLPLTRRGLGIVGLMAPRDIVRALSRTSVTIAALMLAVTVIIGVSIMIDSFRYTVTTWLDAVLAADIYVSPAGQGQGIDGEIAPEFIDRVRQIDGVARIGLLRRASVFSPDTGQVELRATTAQPSDLRRPLLWAEGSPDQALAAMEGDAVMVSEVFARRHGLPLDRPSTLTLTADDGPRPFRVVGIFYDYAEPELGYVFIRLDTYRRYWADDGVSNVALYLSPELAPRADALARELEDRFAGRYTLTISSNRGIKQNALEVFDRTFTITTALRLLAVVVAFIGVLSTLMALQLERTRELGTLRATGMSLGQLWAKTLLETGLIGLTAGLLSWPVGLALALILIYVINLRSFGWSLQLHLSPTIFLLAMAISLSASLLAAVYPVLRMARLEIAAALREE
ncbi:MAG: ABC transporter permease, partial [Chloroflexi bacterium]